MRDSINQALAPNVQERPTLDVYSGGSTFSAIDQWISIISLSQPVGLGISLRTDDGRLLVVSEPFFVSGRQSFQLLQSGSFGISKASRRELLIGPSASEGSKYGAGIGEMYASGGTVGAIGAGQWLYLNSDCTIEAAPSGTLPNGAPFGYNAPNRNFAGRYYEAQWGLIAPVGGLPFVYIVHLLETVVTSYQISAGPAGVSNNGGARIGDYYSALAGSSAWSERAILGSSNWTIAIIVSGATGNVVGDLKVIRQGY